MEVAEAVAQVDIDHLDPLLARDVRASLDAGLAAGAVFEAGRDSDEVFRKVMADALRAIQASDRQRLLPRFLEHGPRDWPRGQPNPRKGKGSGSFLGDAESDAAVRLIHASVINAFQGALAELLAVGPVCALAARLFGSSSTRVHVGDAALVRKLASAQHGKGADLHVLGSGGSPGRPRHSLLAVAEVKSYCTTHARVRSQLEAHLRRARRGLFVDGRRVVLEPVRAGSRPARVLVVPAAWRLSREVRFERSPAGRSLVVGPPVPPTSGASLRQVAADRWLVTLRWSEEALASAAYDMTFWYFGVLGRQCFSEGLPEGLEEMTPEQAGRNLAKQGLHHAILRARRGRDRSRTVALYNAYGFGYALGAHFVDRQGRRQVLFPEDLEEIARTGRARTTPVPVESRGKTRYLPPQNCRITGG